MSDNTNSPSSDTNSPSSGILFTGSEGADFDDVMNDIFNATTYTILFWAISIFTAYSLGSAIFASRGTSNETSGKSSYGRTIDIILSVLLFAWLFSVYYPLTDAQKKNVFGSFITWTQEFFDNSWSFFELIWFTIGFFVLIYILRVPMAPDVKPVLVHLVEHKIWILYAAFAVIFFFKYALSIQVVDLIFNSRIMTYFKNVPPFTSSSPSSSPSWGTSLLDDIDDEIDDIDGSSPGAAPGVSASACSTSSPSNHQVFNISNNLYTYDEAQKVCNAFDASLASYDQIESAYQNGGEWCNYGWSEGQMAYFPTQKDTWGKLQGNPKTQNACGRPGINGGYIKNPYVKFGANCYGVKPNKPDNWSSTSYVKEAEIIDADQNLRNGAKLNGFSEKSWSRY